MLQMVSARAKKARASLWLPEQFNNARPQSYLEIDYCPAFMPASINSFWTLYSAPSFTNTERVCFCQGCAELCVWGAVYALGCIQDPSLRIIMVPQLVAHFTNTIGHCHVHAMRTSFNIFLPQSCHGDNTSRTNTLELPAWKDFFIIS